MELAEVFKKHCSNGTVMNSEEFFESIKTLCGPQKVIEIKSAKITFEKFIAMYYDL